MLSSKLHISSPLHETAFWWGWYVFIRALLFEVLSFIIKGA